MSKLPTTKVVTALRVLGLAATAVLLVGTSGSRANASAETRTTSVSQMHGLRDVGLAPSTTIVSSHASPLNDYRAGSWRLPFADSVEEVGRLTVRLLMQPAIEAEVDTFLGRGPMNNEAR
jgi:hypothetical protein